MALQLINQLKKEQGLTNVELAARAKLTQSTVDKITSGANDNPKLKTLVALCQALGCTLNEVGDMEQPDAPSRAALRLARVYDGLDEFGRRAVEAVLGVEQARIDAEAPAPVLVPTKVIPLFGNSFAAGLGDPDFGNFWEDYAVPADSRADFAIRINGNSMEPYLPDGTVALGVKRTPRDGDVAALLLDGEFLCKQVCLDYRGDFRLFSLNRDRRDADVCIPKEVERSLTCFGTILMEAVPLPTDID